MTTAPLERSTFFVEARVITLDVTVTDGRGKLVGGLEQNDFSIFENELLPTCETDALLDQLIDFTGEVDVRDNNDEGTCE